MRTTDRTEPLVDIVVPATRPWSGVVRTGQLLEIVDLEGRQAVDFLCYAALDPSDRYRATNTLKLHGSAYVCLGTILYSDSGRALFKIIEDSVGCHATIYGCCNEANAVFSTASPERAVVTTSCPNCRNISWIALRS